MILFKINEYNRNLTKIKVLQIYISNLKFQEKILL